jgi:predicted RNase H-like HicB family nuclease
MWKMATLKFVYYQEDTMWVGWLEEYPDYRSQGSTMEELKENLKDIYQEIIGGKIPNIRHVGELIFGWKESISSNNLRTKDVFWSVMAAITIGIKTPIQKSLNLSPDIVK